MVGATAGRSDVIGRLAHRQQDGAGVFERGGVAPHEKIELAGFSLSLCCP